MTTTPNRAQIGRDRTDRPYAGSLIEWRLSTTDPIEGPIGDPPSVLDQVPEHALWLQVYGRTRDGALLTVDDVHGEVTAADTGLTLTPDGWLDIDEQAIFGRLQQLFPGAEVWCAPNEADAKITDDGEDTVIEPIIDLELRAGQAMPPPRPASINLAAQDQVDIGAPRTDRVPHGRARAFPRRTLSSQHRQGKRS